MNRRLFVLGGAGLLAGVGCNRATRSLPQPDAALEQAEQAERVQLLKQLQQFRVDPRAVRRTPEPTVRVAEQVPPLKGLARFTTRLHPRYSAPVPADGSKLGGLFLWPQDEPWPVDAAGVPLAPVLQLRVEDLEPDQRFPEGTNLLQLFWNPLSRSRDDLQPVVFWRNVKEVTTPRQEPPTVRGYASRLPVECRFFPERVQEFPPLKLLPERILNAVDGLPKYDDELASCPGSKVGGYCYGITKETNTACRSCRRPMDFLLAIAGQDWPGERHPRWTPREDQAASAEELAAARGATGLKFSPDPAQDRVNLFLCRRCRDWPVRVV